VEHWLNLRVDGRGVELDQLEAADEEAAAPLFPPCVDDAKQPVVSVAGLWGVRGASMRAADHANRRTGQHARPERSIARAIQGLVGDLASGIPTTMTRVDDQPVVVFVVFVAA
jgi:hypothetical protein